MVTRKEDTPQWLANRRYEERKKENRRASCGNSEKVTSRELNDAPNAFLMEN